MTPERASDYLQSHLCKPTLDDVRTICAHAAEEDKREWGTTHWGGWEPESITATIGTYLDGICHVFREPDGTPFCVSGFYMASPGVARSWTIRTDAWKQHLVQCVRLSRLVIHAVLDNGGANRAEAWCPVWATRWPAALGLSREATLRKYATDGSDIVIWSKVREE